jgi:hypothetical protein
MPWKRRTEIDSRCRAILASFVFNVNAGSGRFGGNLRAREIYRTCPTTFQKLFGNKIKKGASPIAQLCNSLMLQGYAYKIGFKMQKYQAHDRNGKLAIEHEYKSPIYALTEAGYAWVLGNCDERHLFRLFPRRRGNQKYSSVWVEDIQGYDPSLPATRIKFENYAGINTFVDRYVQESSRSW